MTIHDTSVVPYIIAETVVHDYMESNSVQLPYSKFEQLRDFLVGKSERIFSCNSDWRKGLLKAKDSREYLCSFMVHWLQSHILPKNKNTISQLNLF